MVHSVYFQSLNKKNHHTLEYSSWNILLKGFSMWIQWIDNIHNLHACTSMWVSFCFWDDVNRVTCLCLGTYEIHCLWSEGNFQQSFWLCVVDENHMLKNTILTGEWEQKRNKYFNSSSKKPFFLHKYSHMKTVADKNHSFHSYLFMQCENFGKWNILPSKKGVVKREKREMLLHSFCLLY